MAVAQINNQITFAISVKDRHKSAEWYEKMLGFQLLHHIDEAGWSEMATMTENVILGLGDQTEPTPGNSVPVFGVEDIAREKKALEAEGVKFDGDIVTYEDMVSMVSFYDPDGNAMMLAQDLAGA